MMILMKHDSMLFNILPANKDDFFNIMSPINYKFTVHYNNVFFSMYLPTRTFVVFTLQGC